MIGVNANNADVMAATSQTLKRLRDLTGFSQKGVLLGFAGVVLKQWAGRTKVATQAKIDRKSRLRAVKHFGLTNAAKRGDVTVNAGFKKSAPYGRVWIRVRNGGGKNNFIMARGQDFSAVNGKQFFTPYRRKINGTSGQWLNNVANAEENVQRAMPGYIARGRRSIGLSRQSVIQIADSLGIDLLKVQGGGNLSAAGIAKARAALASTGKFHKNGTGLSGKTGAFDFVDLINTLPYARKIGMDRTLLGVLRGQNKYFNTSYAKGAFDSQRKATAAYPNLFRINTYIR